MFRRLLTATRCFTTKSNVSKLRNIGIIAHIDAGKTTTTERMLYFSGKTKRIGDVDQGDTITDFLPQERSRGITIQSAAISFNWQDDFKINLIDTPGHADFTFEVIRSLKVLDGCVTILDAVAGVEAQTEKVWRQSKGIPKVCFINKMDRTGAGYSRTVKELIVKMNTRALLVNIPIFSYDASTRESIFEGVLDVVNGKALKWVSNDPDNIIVENVSEGSKYFEELKSCRESLVETLSEIDEELVEHFLEEAEGDYMKVHPAQINKSIRHATLTHHATPILCGASFKNIGVQPLLDAVVNYLPSPVEAKFPELNHSDVPMKYDPKNGILINNNKSLCVAMAFKVVTDPIRGIMVFIRVYSGTLNSGHTVYNSSTGVKFKIGKLVVMHANVPEEVKQLNAGEIGVLTGSTVSENVRTGDTIISHTMKRDGLKSLNKATELSLRINPIEIPPPVFSAAIEPRTLGNRKSMEDSLATLTREDPSLHISKDEETGQTLLSGMGELHLEIAKDRLLNELNAEIEVGKVMVSYKETVNKATQPNSTETDDGYKLTLGIEPFKEDRKDSKVAGEEWHSLGSDSNYLVMERHHEFNTTSNWPFQIPYEALVNALMSSSIAALQKGGTIANFPLHSTVVRVKGDWSLPQDATSAAKVLSLSRPLITTTLNQLQDSDYSVLEPIMNVEVSVQQQDMGAVIQDLTGARKANILSIDEEHEIASGADSNITFERIAEEQYLPRDTTLELANIKNENKVSKVIKARVPLKDMVSYTNKLRSLTQGRGNFHMDYHGMEKVTQERLQSVLENY